MKGSGTPKLTDLTPVKLIFTKSNDDSIINISVYVDTIHGPVNNQIAIDVNTSVVKLIYNIKWTNISIGSFQMGHITLNLKNV